MDINQFEVLTEILKIILEYLQMNFTEKEQNKEKKIIDDNGDSANKQTANPHFL